jgi:tetratricopeptide (TPR) repeat protein
MPQNMTPDDLFKQANSLQLAGRLAEAGALYRRLLDTSPDNPKLLNNLGRVLVQSGKESEAVILLQRTLAQDPGQPLVLFNLGVALRRLKRLPHALACFNRCLALIPEHAPAHFQRGLVLASLKRFVPALASIEHATALGHVTAIVHNNRGNVLTSLGRYEEALASYGQALALEPDLLEGYANRGLLLQQLHRYDEAMANFEQAIALRPDFAPAHVNKALLTLGLGDYAQGWARYEWRWKAASPDRLRKFKHPAWRGADDIGGKTLLVWGEAGMGDVIQFARFVPLLEARGARVVMEAAPPLVPLLPTLSSSGAVSAVVRGRTLPEYDLQCPVMSLPFVFGTTLSTLPAQVPYLHADAARRAVWRARLGDKIRPRVGLVWSGRPGAEIDFNPCRNRSIPLAQLAPLLQLPLEFHCLQKEVRPQDGASLTALPQIRMHAAELHDFAETAALIEEVDLVVSIDTSVAHLAGALGKPLCVLLPFATDFRWTLDQSATPWYPSARLFRQPTIADWVPAVASMVRHVAQMKF